MINSDHIAYASGNIEQPTLLRLSRIDQIYMEPKRKEVDFHVIRGINSVKRTLAYNQCAYVMYAIRERDRYTDTTVLNTVISLEPDGSQIHNNVVTVIRSSKKSTDPQREDLFQ